MARISKLIPFTSRLGKETDATIAQDAGVSVENVRTYRRRRGIPSAQAQGVANRTPKRARKTVAVVPAQAMLLPPAPAMPPAVPAVQEAYRVSMIQTFGACEKVSRGVVLGASIRDAIDTTLVRFPTAIIKGIWLVGPILWGGGRLAG